MSNTLQQVENSPDVKNFIRQHEALFWWIKEGEKEHISHSLLVETILNYGDETDVESLFKLLGIEKVAAIFRSQTQHGRNNYHDPIRNYFELYFNRHVPGYTQ